jgi:hypothetical protein
VRLRRMIDGALEWLTRRWRNDFITLDAHGDETPSKIARRHLIRMIDEGEAWAVVMMCPCGCGEVIELSLSPASRVHWKLSVDGNRPTLTPSVRRNTGCRSHFWLRRGRIFWCP